ncbi:MAG TPA: response regulator, partial [Candidatus Limnocylindrales bacterium]
MTDTGSAQVLLVEDDEPLAAVVARHLNAHGLPTEVVTSTEEAERRLDAGLRPGLVLLDINLPGETGWSLLRGRAYAAAGRPRVIVVSAT